MGTMEPYGIVLADDHVLIRKGLRRILSEREHFEVVGEANDGIELLHLLDKVAAHLVILDISMPNLRGIEAVHEIKTTHPDTRVLILTMHKDPDFLYQAISAGADGYLLKEDAEIELFSAIDKILQKKVYISPSLSEESKEDWVQITRGRRNTPFVAPLTNREREILKLIAEGKLNKEIADLLCISVHTVERHRANIMEKLNLKNTAEIVKYAIQKGYL
jgi:DNA-binding NarL/FixJ family response regulator